VIVVEKPLKARVTAEIDVIDKTLAKPALFDGFVKKYVKKREGEEDVPSQSQNVQKRCAELLPQVSERLAEMFDMTAQKDFANCEAKGDVVVDDDTIVAGVPTTTLLFLEKQLADLHTLVGRLPVLDPAEVWRYDGAAGLYRTEPTLTSRTKKVQKPIVLYPHSDKHPAQTQLITEDETVGTWELTRLSGAVPDGDRKKLLSRIEKLRYAVKRAREGANLVDAPPRDVGTKIMGWVFKP
jgi:hypothetical protein